MKENTNTFKDAGAGIDPDKFSALNPRQERAQRRGSLQVWATPAGPCTLANMLRLQSPAAETAGWPRA